MRPFREDCKPPCDCEWCRFSRWRRSLTWSVRAFPRLLFLIGTPSAALVCCVGLITSGVRDCAAREAADKAIVHAELIDMDERERRAPCVDEVTILNSFETHRCRHEARAEVKPVGPEDRLVLFCRCPDTASLPQE